MKISKEQGRGQLYAELVQVDPDTAVQLHPNDEAKVIRALEVHRLSGRPLSEWHRQHGFQEAAFSALLIGLLWSREVLYRRIEERIDWQLSHGMIEETRALLDRGYGRHLGAMKGLGYRQVAAHLVGDYDYVETVRRFKRDTRHFAKRQMTWFRKEPGIQWVSIEENERLESIVGRVVALINQFLETLERTARSAVMQETAGREGSV
jgi:tRNA dimethylallyltransferase